MIPSSWWRRALLLLMFWLFAIGMLWAAYSVFPDDPGGLGVTVVGIVLLLSIHAGAPVTARLLAPMPCSDSRLEARLTNAASAAAVLRPIVLYDYAEAGACAVGILAGHARIYLTSGMLKKMSDEGLRGILAHEETHVREHHVLLIFLYSGAYLLLAQVVGHNGFFVVAFFSYLALRRYLEYRADAGAAMRVGVSAAIIALKELANGLPPRKWERWMTFAMYYPSLPMRIAALENGSIRLF